MAARVAGPCLDADCAQAEHFAQLLAAFLFRASCEQEQGGGAAPLPPMTFWCLGLLLSNPTYALKKYGVF